MASAPDQLELDTSLRTRARRTQMRFAATDRADRTSRRVLTTVLILVAVAAALALAASFGAFGTGVKNKPILSRDLLSHIERQARWIWLAIGVLAFLIALLALRWLGRMIIPEPASDDFHRSRTEAGETTVVGANAVAAIVGSELAALPGVTDASARLAPDGTTATAWVRLDDAVDVDDLATHVGDQVLPRLRRSLGRDDLSIDLELRPSTTAASRVA